MKRTSDYFCQLAIFCTNLQQQRAAHQGDDLVTKTARFFNKNLLCFSAAKPRQMNHTFAWSFRRTDA